jgi:hypothetical protein
MNRRNLSVIIIISGCIFLAFGLSLFISGRAPSPAPAPSLAPAPPQDGVNSTVIVVVKSSEDMSIATIVTLLLGAAQLLLGFVRLRTK